MKSLTVKKMYTLLAVVVGLFFVVSFAVYLVSVKLDWDREAPPQSPRGDQDVTIYAINPDTILKSLENGKTNVLTTFSDDPATYVSPWLSKSFSWNQQLYLNIASELHRQVSKEPLESWYLYNGFFRKFDCSDDSDGFDQARFIYYQSNDDLYIVHELWITPSEGQAGIGIGYYPYSGKWNGIDLMSAKIKSAYEAFEVAEKNGGEELRLSAGDNCTITIELAPYAYKTADGLWFQNDYSWGWLVRYSSNNASVFNASIDPYTGNFQINNGP